jgi:hypothetical protein
MKRAFAFLAAAVVFSAIPAHAQNPRGEAKLVVGDKQVSIDYGRPSLKGRDMLGQAQVGQAWRMGADSATTMKSEADLSFGTVAVPKGDYVLTAKKVDEGTWHLVFTDKDKKAVEVPLATTSIKENVEMFTVELRGEKGKGELELKWGTTSLKAAFAAK